MEPADMLKKADRRGGGGSAFVGEEVVTLVTRKNSGKSTSGLGMEESLARVPGI